MGIYVCTRPFCEQLKELAGEFLEIFKRHTGKPFPQDPYEQLEISVGAVFRSWTGKRAVDYRKQFKITKDKANGWILNLGARRAPMHPDPRVSTND